MKKREPVSHIMTKNVRSVDVTDDLHKAVAMFRKYHIRHLPVTEHGKIVGILSSTDINRLTFGALFENQEGADEAILEMLSIKQVMSESLYKVSSTSLIREVADIFTKQPFHALPVVDGDELVGIVTTTDLIGYLLAQY